MTAQYVLAQIAVAASARGSRTPCSICPSCNCRRLSRSGPAQWLSEFVAAFGLLSTIFGCLRFRPDFVPTAVGLYIIAAYWFTASTSFANPAVTIARALTDSFAGIAPGGVMPFIVAQIAGAYAAAGLSGWLFAREAGDRG